MKIQFSKMHGIGNNYIYIDGSKYPLSDPQGFSKFISNKNYGVGSDGLILIYPSKSCDFQMRMFNADGSEGKMCGNGIRCVGKFVYDNKMTNKTTLTIETLAGVKVLDLIVKDNKVEAVRVDMGKPDLTAKNIPVLCDGETFIHKPYKVLGKEYFATAVSMGNPHCVIFTEHIDQLDLLKIGPYFENHEIFPDRVNTEFVERISPTLFRMRVWERGSGETMACGTGACAVAVAACLNGFAKKGTDITVGLSGGDLNIRWEESEVVTMTGPASHIFDGVINIEK